jgi:hypothetical protein
VVRKPKRRKSLREVIVASVSLTSGRRIGADMVTLPHAQCNRTGRCKSVVLTRASGFDGRPNGAEDKIGEPKFFNSGYRPPN